MPLRKARVSAPRGISLAECEHSIEPLSLSKGSVQSASSSSSPKAPALAPRIDRHDELPPTQNPCSAEATPALPPFREQLTVRAVIVGLVLSVLFSIIIMKLDLTAGIIPGFGAASCLIAWAGINGWLKAAKALNAHGIAAIPFSPQENTVIQAVISGGTDLAFSGGYGGYYTALSMNAYKNLDGQHGNSLHDVWSMDAKKAMAYGACIAFAGLFVILQLRKVVIINWHLPWAGSAATGTLVNSLHTRRGERQAWKQVKVLSFFGSSAFSWSFFKWFFGGSKAGESKCGAGGNPTGFDAFPNLGLKAHKWKWYFSNELVYVGTGMIVPQIVNLSILAGAVLSWGILWPVINTKAGQWYPVSTDEHNVKGLFGYQIFLQLGMALGDTLYRIIKLAVSMASAIVRWYRARHRLPQTAQDADPGGGQATADTTESQDLGFGDKLETEEQRKLREHVFLSESFPKFLSLAGFFGCAAIAAGIIPKIFPPARWYQILVMFAFGPLFSIANSYAAGLINWNLASTWGKLSLVVFAAWSGQQQGVTAGLVTSGIMLALTNAACAIMGDFKLGYYTCTSPQALFIAQFIGEVFNVFTAPAVFYIFLKGNPDLGLVGSTYPAPFSTVYRALAITAAEGVEALPRHALVMALACFLAAIALCLLKDFGPRFIRPYVPIPMAMAIPFYIGAWLAVDFCIGGAIIFIWEKLHYTSSRKFVMPVAAGMLMGEGVWSLPSAVLGIFDIQPPVCMTFYPGKGSPAMPPSST